MICVGITTSVMFFLSKTVHVRLIPRAYVLDGPVPRFFLSFILVFRFIPSSTHLLKLEASSENCIIFTHKMLSSCYQICSFLFLTSCWVFHKRCLQNVCHTVEFELKSFLNLKKSVIELSVMNAISICQTFGFGEIAKISCSEATKSNEHFDMKWLLG